MDFQFTSEQVALRKRVEEFCQAQCSHAQEATRDREPSYPVAMHKAMAESGILGYCLPKAYGGSGGGPIELCIINETVGRFSSSAMNILFVNGVCAALIGLAGNEDQKQEFVRGVAEARLRFAFALTEPGAGSDAAGIQCRAVADGDNYVINGTKLYTTGAQDADYIMTVARSSMEGKASRGTSILITPVKSKGLKITAMDKIAGNDVASCRVEYKDVRVPAANRLGAENQGWSTLMMGGALERLTVAASCIGAAQAAFDEALAHVQQREQYGQPVGRFQSIQHQLADMATEIEAMRLLTYSAAWRTQQGMMPAKEISMAKLYCSEKLNEIVMRGMRLLGGKAYLSETPMPRRLRESILSLYAGGTVEIQRNLIAKSLGL